jgi:hypothetical protein
MNQFTQSTEPGKPALRGGMSSLDWNTGGLVGT